MNGRMARQVVLLVLCTALVPGCARRGVNDARGAFATCWLLKLGNRLCSCPRPVPVVELDCKRGDTGNEHRD